MRQIVIALYSPSIDLETPRTIQENIDRYVKVLDVINMLYTPAKNPNNIGIACDGSYCQAVRR